MSSVLESNTTAVVTGSSSGIGRAIALELARVGYDLVVHASRSVDSASEVSQDVKRLGRRCVVLAADFNETESLVPFAVPQFDALGPVTVWVNNAGADVLTGDAADWSFAKKAMQLWRTDVLSTLILSREAGRLMRKRGTDHRPGPFSIINIGWDQAFQGMAGDSGELFSTVKGAVMWRNEKSGAIVCPRHPSQLRGAWMDSNDLGRIGLGNLAAPRPIGFVDGALGDS